MALILFEVDLGRSVGWLYWSTIIRKRILQFEQ